MIQRKNFGAKPILYPMPVLILAAYDENGKPNAMNAAWGGISDENEISVCISATHKTTENILAKKAFTVSVADVENVVAADFVGVVSGTKDPDKMKKTGWHDEKSSFVDAPLFKELPLTLECVLESYETETGRLVGKIVNVSAAETILAPDGKIDPTLLRPITYDPVRNTYNVIGEVVGKAFSDGLKLK